MRGGAAKAVLADLALRAVVVQEGISATDEATQSGWISPTRPATGWT